MSAGSAADGNAADGNARMVKGSLIIGRRNRPEKDFRIKTYDFRRPDKFSKEQIRTIALVHDAFSRLAATSLSAALRQDYRLALESVDQMTFEEFIGPLKSPNFFAVVGMAPLRGSVIVQMDPVICRAVADRLFGGRGKGMAGPDHELTDIELRTIEGTFIRILGDLREAWTPLLDLRPSLLHSEVHERFSRIVPPTEMIVLVTFRMTGEGTEGRMNLVIPYLTIEPLIPRLAARYMYSKPRASRNGAADRTYSIKEEAYRLPAAAELLVQGPELSIRELLELKKGSLVALPELDEGRCRLRAGGAQVLDLKLESRLRGRFFLRVPGGPPRGDSSAEGEGRGAEGRGAEAKPDLKIERMGGEIAAIRESLASGLGAIASELKAIRDGRETVGVGADRVSAAMSASPPPGDDSPPFASLRAFPEDALLLFLSAESPQLIALVASQLDGGHAARIVGGLGEGLQAEVLQRIAAMDRVAPAVLETVERALLRALEASRKDYRSFGGMEKAAGLLGLVPDRTRDRIFALLDEATARRLRRSFAERGKDAGHEP